MFDVIKFRQCFPLLRETNDGRPLIYFDNGATTQKPEVVIQRESDFYQCQNANVHRSAHYLSAQATTAFEQSRTVVKEFINANATEEIIWTKGTTESINLVAYSWGLHQLTHGDEIVLSYAEHHANIVPWQIVAQKTGAIINVIPLDATGVIDESTLDTFITSRTKIVCSAHVTNVIGKLNPIDAIIRRAKSVGAVTLIDGAQAIAHFPVDVKALDCDFYVFSAHKMYGPTGVGVLYGKRPLLEQMTPYQTGGEMIKEVRFSGTTFNKLPYKFEPGTPNIAGIVAFSSAISFINEYQLNQFHSYEQQLIDYCYQRLNDVDSLQFIVEGKPNVGIFSFVIKGHHQQDIATGLDSKGIAVRAGHHCAMPLMEYLNIDGCIRVSLSPYNSISEIDVFINALQQLLGQDAQHHASEPTTTTRKIDDVDAIITQFTNVKSWDSKHREIMMLGKSLVRMPKNLRTDNARISGCESAAWLTVNKRSDNTYYFEADSDAKVIRGLLVIVLAAYNYKTAKQIQHFDIEGYFSHIGLLQHLSPSRGNGLLAIVNTIKQSVIVE